MIHSSSSSVYFLLHYRKQKKQIAQQITSIAQRSTGMRGITPTFAPPPAPSRRPRARRQQPAPSIISPMMVLPMMQQPVPQRRIPRSQRRIGGRR